MEAPAHPHSCGPVPHSALLVPRRRRQAAGWQTYRWRLLALLALVALVFWVRPLLINDEGRPQKMAQRVTLLTTPEPPPPPLEKPPEVEVMRQPVEIPTPSPTPEAPIPGERLGVDAEGEGAGDDFGLVAKPGGQDIITLGGGWGGESADRRLAFGLYAGLIRQRMESELAGKNRFAKGEHVTVVEVWVNERGRVERMEITRSSGVVAVDRALRDAFAVMPVLPEPPYGMPMPLRMRITTVSR